MYSQINQFSETVVGSIPHTHIADYEWLLQNTAQASSPDYQKRCRFYWAMNVAQMSPPFYTAYFGALDAAMKELMTLGLRHSRQITRVCSPRVTHDVPPTQVANAGFSWVPSDGEKWLARGQIAAPTRIVMKTIILPSGSAFGVDDIDGITA